MIEFVGNNDRVKQVKSPKPAFAETVAPSE
jgi:hypothetical protein